MITTLLLSAAAFACGGLFCNTAAPVDQAAEEIVFAVDGETIEMHIAITWEGRSDDFAWVLPVPAEPELFLSSTELFTALRVPTDPVFAVVGDSLGRCGPIRLGCTNELKYSPQNAEGWSNDATVVDTARIGPFETVTLKADSSAALMGWLTEHAYDLPPGLEPLLDPYIAADSHFVAMRLAADSDTGDIEPIGLRYPGTAMAIPIQLTAVAAAPDLPVRVYVLAADRAVPESYLHVELNEAALDWPGGGSNYPELVAEAVDAAGGQAFLTEFAGRLDSVLTLEPGPEVREVLLGHPYLTRMITALSADEMTLDPTFAVHPGLPDVSNQHVATLMRDCRGSGDDDAPSTAILEDGREVALGALPADGGTARKVDDLQDVPALRVSDFAGGVETEVLDYAKDAAASLNAHNERYAAGCGCASAPGPLSLVGAGLLIAVVGFRRRG